MGLNLMQRTFQVVFIKSNLTRSFKARVLILITIEDHHVGFVSRAVHIHNIFRQHRILHVISDSNGIQLFIFLEISLSHFVLPILSLISKASRSCFSPRARKQFMLLSYSHLFNYSPLSSCCCKTIALLYQLGDATGEAPSTPSEIDNSIIWTTPIC